MHANRPEPGPVPPPTRESLLLGPIVRFFIYGAIILKIQHGLVLWLPAEQPMDIVGEDQRLEMAQNVILLLAFLMSACIARWDVGARPLAILAAGLALAVLVREQNNRIAAMDLPVKMFVILLGILGASLAIGWRWRRGFPAALNRFLRSPAFGWCGSGVIAVTFAQLLDERGLWVPILGEDMPYAVRRAGEEIGELLAYLLFLFGLFEWYLALRRDRKLS